MRAAVIGHVEWVEFVTVPHGPRPGAIDPAALRRTRAAHAVVATARVIDTLAAAHAELDAVVGSGTDAAERYQPLDPPPRYVVTTAGSAGGTWSGADGQSGSWAAAVTDS